MLECDLNPGDNITVTVPVRCVEQEAHELFEREQNAAGVSYEGMINTMDAVAELQPGCAFEFRGMSACGDYVLADRMGTVFRVPVRVVELLRS